MVSCSVCQDDANYGILRNPLNSPKTKKEKQVLNYEPQCGKCLYRKLRVHDDTYQTAILKECPDIIFGQSQINQGIITTLKNLSTYIQQGENLIDQIYRRQPKLFYYSKLRQQISQAIIPIIDQISGQVIQNLYETIKFATSEINKIKRIKLKIEGVLNEYGNVNLLNQDDYLNVCQQDIKKYNLECMMHLTDKIQKSKDRIILVLGIDL